ncbi:MAG TPA: glycosyltransferase family 39 protein [Verrucomicrobiae bacterium]|nr:glycosyltransferase family 39 protein [Verrucomicrobiae bacterium]
MKARWLIPLLIVAAGIAAYCGSFQGPFIFDDVPSIPENPYIRHLWPLHRALFSPPYSTLDVRPVVCLTLAGNYAVGGLDVRGYHAFNLAVHLLSALVLFGIARRTLEEGSFRDRLGAAAAWLAAAITLIWEVHPLQTESVTYIIQRTELLMGLFLLLTLYCTLRGSRSDHPRAWYLLAVVSCALGMGCKQVMVIAPLIVLLYDRVFLASSFRELWRKRAGLYPGLAATWLLLAVLVANTPHRTAGYRIGGPAPWNYLMTETGVILYYLRLCFWPHPLVIDYLDWPVASSLDDVLLPGVAVVGLLGATVWAFRHRPWLGFLGAWFFLILAPTSSFVPVAGELAAERRMYLPLAAVVTIAVVGAFLIGKRLLIKHHGSIPGCVAVASVVVVLTFLTIQRNRDYRSDVTIWQDTVDKRPHNTRAQNNLAWLLATLDPPNADPARAVALAERACQSTGYQAAPYLDTLAVAYAAAGRFNDAIATAQKAIDLARAAGQTQVVAQVEPRLELYRHGRAYRQSTGAANPPQR